ncbi:MAG: RNA-binding transcriptional accessory protein [Clostridiales bacterium]|nr:RNA-binding transcriptional accessory protein [Clostridiales bacterium]
MDILKALVNEFKLKPEQVENTVKLIDEGSTIPFIARYRKEVTGELDDQVLRELNERLVYLRGLEEKRAQVKKSISDQGKLDAELEAALDKAATLTEIEDLYRPFRPKRRTRATIAKERGLEPLAMAIWAQDLTAPVSELALAYVNAELEVATVDDAIAGALDIIAEIMSDDATCRTALRKLTWENAILQSEVAKPQENSVYEMYYEYQEPVSRIVGHRVLAVNRGEDEGVLKVWIEVPVDHLLTVMHNLFVKDNRFTRDYLTSAIEDSYKRLIAPSIERDVRKELTETAQEGAIKVFGANLKQLLLQSPIKGQVVLAMDPGIRTGCKIAVIDDTGKVLDHGVAFCSNPKREELYNKAKVYVKDLIQKYKVTLIAIGNGTASRETEAFTAEVLKEITSKVHYAIVSEAGASVYSASPLGAKEFPEFDVTVRGAISIGRRLQDPLAELVKIDPKSIGVGQYQHDMNQKRLSEALGGVVESCVNSVGVDLNTASPSLLGYVAGVSGTVAKNILDYREENGKFVSRSDLKKVKKLGAKTFEQCAGFLRIPGSVNPLDNTGVHPESYSAAEKLLKTLGYSLADVSKRRVSDLKKRVSNGQELAEQLGIGFPTLQDIIKELEKPGRDPRDEMPPPILRNDVLSMDDLLEGMELQGTVRNVIDFGAFVDIGVHTDGLVHKSQFNKRVKHPLEAVSVGDIIKVRVVSVDKAKNRIALTMKGVSDAPR